MKPLTKTTPPREREMTSKVTVEVGKSYVTRNGHIVRIEAETNSRGTYRMQGVDDQDRVTWRSRKGRFESRPHHLDLIAEARTAEGIMKGLLDELRPLGRAV